MWAYAVLGMIQGVLEWFPLSSEGLVALTSQFLLPKDNPVDIALFLHLGTLLAVLIYFRKAWIDVLLFRDRELLKFLVIATVVSLVVGYPLYKLVRNVAVGSVLLAITGLGLLVTAYFHRDRKTFNIGSNWLALIAGFLQGLAVIPGLSRSGSTIFGLSLGKTSPAEIMKISYMMSVPVVLASSIYLFLQSPKLISDSWLGLLCTAVVGFFSLHFLINVAARINFFRFALIFALICFVGATIGFLVLGG